MNIFNTKHNVWSDVNDNYYQSVENTIALSNNVRFITRHLRIESNYIHLSPDAATQTKGMR